MQTHAERIGSHPTKTHRLLVCKCVRMFWIKKKEKVHAMTYRFCNWQSLGLFGQYSGLKPPKHIEIQGEILCNSIQWTSMSLHWWSQLSSPNTENKHFVQRPLELPVCVFILLHYPPGKVRPVFWWQPCTLQELHLSCRANAFRPHDQTDLKVWTIKCPPPLPGCWNNRLM